MNENEEEYQEPLDQNEPEVEEVTSSEELPESSEVVESNDDEVKAKKHGYLTKEEYVAKHGTEEGFKSPQQFNKFGESYEEVKDILKGLRSEISKRDKEQEALVKYIDGVRDRERDAAKKELQQAMQQAEENGDVSAIRQLAQIQAAQTYEEQQQQVVSYHKEAQTALYAFQEKNKHWFNAEHPELVQRAHEIEQEILAGAYSRQYGVPMPKNYDQLSKLLEAAMKAEYPDVVDTRTRKVSPTISSTDSAVNKSAAVSVSTNKVFNGLPNDLKQVFSATKRIAEKNGYKYTQEDFIRKLKSDGEIE